MSSQESEIKMPEIDLSATTLGKYQVRKPIGRGGMGTVYAAYDTALDRPVAIKVLASHLAWEETFVERFLREARMAAKLDHPHIVTIYDVGQQDGIYYLVMRQIEGQPLRDIIAREGPLPPARAARILGQVASALDYAHSRGVIHRDVKPGNMLVETGDRVTLTDFGVARAAEGTRLTATGISLGTPEYMSPEQALGQATDGRTDVYSLGIVLYEMLTGQVPFHADTPIATLMQQAHTPPPSPRTLVSSLSAEIETVVLKALAKRPEDRYASAGELGRTMDRLVTQDRAAQLRQQVAEARSWIAKGQYDRAIERLEALARVHPGDRQIAAGLAEAREQVHLAGIYAEVQQLWGQAQAKAQQILTAAPGYADPDRVLARLRGRRVEAVVEHEEDWPRWLNQVALALIVIGGLAGAILHRPNVQWAVNPGICLLFVLLAVLSIRPAVALRMRRVLAAFNLALVLFTVAQTKAIVPLPYVFGVMRGLEAPVYILQLGLLLGSAAICWALFVRRRAGWAGALMALGGLVVLLSYTLEWARLPDPPWDRGYDLVYQKLYAVFGGNTSPQWIDHAYPSWLRCAVVLLPAMNLLGALLLSFAPDDLDRTRRRIKAAGSLLLAGLGLLGMIVCGTPYFRLFNVGHPVYLFEIGYLGLWLMLVGLALVLVGVVLRAVPFLRGDGTHSRSS
jgi:hypothetical protein